MDEHVSQMFRRKNDVYYIILLVYMIFGGLYVLITGTATEDTFAFGWKDPVIYIIGLFFLYALIMLIANLIRRQELIISQNHVVYKTRFGERSIPIGQIRAIVLTRRRRQLGNGTLPLIKFRTMGRKRWYRIKPSNYEREHELFLEFKRIKSEHSL